MPTLCRRPLLAAVVAFALLSPSPASARGIVLVTWGETISHIGHVSPQIVDAQGARNIGYKYGYFGVFWIDLWTHGGTFCVYEGKKYGPVPPAEAARLLGTSEASLSAPFLYHVPLGWLILGPLVVIGMVVSAFRRRRDNQVVRLFDDERYQKAFEILNEQYAKQLASAALSVHGRAEAEPAESTPAETGEAVSMEVAESPETAADDSCYRAAFEAGVQHLVEVGIPREEAERNLAAMMNVLCQAQPQEPATPAEGNPSSSNSRTGTETAQLGCSASP
jgi:hypothetical protein